MRSEFSGCSGRSATTSTCCAPRPQPTPCGAPIRCGCASSSTHSRSRRASTSPNTCASEGWGPPRDNGDAARLLGVHGVLPLDLADRLRRAVGFRNVLVPDYVEVDDGIVLDRLANLVDLDDFVAAVAGWVV